MSNPFSLPGSRQSEPEPNQYAFGSIGIRVVRGFYLAVPPLRPKEGETRQDAWSRHLHLLGTDYPEIFSKTWKWVVFIGRYGGQPISTVESWPISKVVRVGKFLSDFLQEENRKSMPGQHGMSVGRS